MWNSKNGEGQKLKSKNVVHENVEKMNVDT